MSKWKWAGLVALLVVTNVYSLLVGKYEYFPYRQISAFKQRIIAALQVDYFFVLEKKSPRVQEEKRLAEARETNRVRQYDVVADVVGRIRDLVYASAPRASAFDVALPAPAGYVTERSVAEGGTINVCVHAPQGATAELFRLGREKTLVRQVAPVGPISQSARYSPDTGLAWKANLAIPTAGLKSGYYLLELRDASQRDRLFQVPIVIKPRKAPRIAFIASTYTWQAFNDFGGKNFYFDHQSPSDVAARRDALDGILTSLGQPRLPVHLPNARLLQPTPAITETRPDTPYYSHLLRAEWNLVAFAEANGIDYGVYSDNDFATAAPAVLDAQIIVFGAHTEYWSAQMMDRLRAYTKKGGKVVFAGGNAIFKLVERTSRGIDMIDNVPPQEAAALAGTYTSDVANPFYAPYKVVDADHWVLAGTGLTKGALFGRTSLNHRQEASAQGVSGWEADQMGPGSEGFRLLATGTNLRGPAHMVFKDTPAGGWVFNASAIPFSGALFTDPVIARIMLNLLHGGPAREPHVPAS